MLASMRLCAPFLRNTPIQTALGGYQSISEFITLAVVFMSSVTARGN